MSNIENSYIRFLNVTKALESKVGLDAIQKQLLDVVMLANLQEKEVLVGDLLALGHVGSQATLHGRVKSLIILGYVKLVTDKIDGRKKQVVPTKLAIKHYDNLSMLLAKAVSA